MTGYQLLIVILNFEPHQLNKKHYCWCFDKLQYLQSDEKTNGRTEEFDNNVYKRFTILDTQDDIANTT
jgi:uncharacterized membrane-anchored protein YjiN (DUF445 family)